MPSLHRYALATLLLALPLIAAQDGDQSQNQGKADPNQPPPSPAPENASDHQGDESMADYPQWYSNDYNCVINCMQVFNGVTSRERNSTLDASWVSCINQACDKQYASQNIYQGFYIAEMFYDTGSIYECDGKPCEPQAAPSPSRAAPGTGATEVSGAGVATGPGGDDHTASTAVSIPDLKTAVRTTATATGTASEAAATDTGAVNWAGRADWSLGMGVAAAMAWGAVAVL